MKEVSVCFKNRIFFEKSGFSQKFGTYALGFSASEK